MSFDDISPAADRLAFLRREVARMRNEMRELRVRIIAGQANPVGHFHVARVEHHVVLHEIEPAYDTADGD